MGNRVRRPNKRIDADRVMAALEDYLETGKTLEKVLKAHQISWGLFYKVRRMNSAVAARYEEVLRDKADFFMHKREGMADSLVSVDPGDDAAGDPFLARRTAQAAAILLRQAEAYDRERFSPHIDVSTSTTIDLAGSIAAARARVRPPIDRSAPDAILLDHIAPGAGGKASEPDPFD